MDIINQLQAKIDQCNQLGNLNIQLVVNVPKAFSGIMAYGKFWGIESVVMGAIPNSE